MRLSRFFLPTLKETPADADNVSARLMLRAGMIRKVAAGLYEWLPLGFRVLRKVEGVIRSEMERAGALEVWLPHVQPRSLWEETGRWGVYGKELLRFKDRKNNDFCFAPTAEEVITDLVRNNLSSYRDLPKNLFQFGTKFRDEIRPRFGVMRAREFYMKDAYSFHATGADLDHTYQTMVDVYTRIFTRLGLRFRPVDAATGTIGGNVSHEFMVLAETGEEDIADCAGCGYAANIERAETRPPDGPDTAPMLPAEEVSTPNLTRVDEVAGFLSVGPDRIIKTVFLIVDDAPVVALVRGDTDLSESKLLRALGATKARPAKDDEYREMAGCEPGFGGPVGLKARVIADHLVPAMRNGLSGGGRKDIHRINLNAGRDFTPDVVADIRSIRPGDACPRCGVSVAFSKGIEVGHVFKLGTKYSAAMKATFLDEHGDARPFEMGCYGIGVSRIVAAAIEQNHDQHGIRWPLPVAPFDVIVTPANMSDEGSRAAAETAYDGLLGAGVEVLFDDRDVRAGGKFKDADLIGIPLRVTIGERSLARGVVELKARDATTHEDVALADLIPTVTARLSDLRARFQP